MSNLPAMATSLSWDKVLAQIFHQPGSLAIKKVQRDCRASDLRLDIDTSLLARSGDGRRASVNGSMLPPVFGKAITSRIESVSDKRAQIRSHPRRSRHVGAAALNASSRKPNRSCASS